MGPPICISALLPATTSGDLAVRPSLLAEEHGGALLRGGIPGHPRSNQHTEARTGWGSSVGSDATRRS